MEPNSSESCDVNVVPLNRILPPFMIVEFLLGLPGNVVALWIFCFRLKVSRPNIVYLLNLAVADFLLLIGLPFQIDTYKREMSWVFGDALCRINLFMLAVNRSASIAFMTIIAMDRYFKVVHPHHHVNQLTDQHARLIAGLAWTAVVSLRLPLLTSELNVIHNNKSLCYSFGHKHPLAFGVRLHYVVFVGEFFLPLLLLMFCSFRIVVILRHRFVDREKKVRRAIRVVMVVMGIFVVCFSPSIIIGLIALGVQMYTKKACNRLMSDLFRLSIAFTYINSAMDPAIYCFSSSAFLHTLKTSFNKLGLCRVHLSRRGSTASDG